MKGNNRDCICAFIERKHSKRCNAYRLSEMFKKCASVIRKDVQNDPRET